MNTGQRLVALSGLAGVSALAHFAALQAGGSGVGQTVFADRFTLLVEEPQLVLTRKLVKQGAPVERPTPTSSPAQGKFVFVTTLAEQALVRTATDEFYVRSSPQPSLSVSAQRAEVFARRNSIVSKGV